MLSKPVKIVLRKTKYLSFATFKLYISNIWPKNKKKDDPNYIDCIIVQIYAGGTGLNLQMFNSVWFSNISWNPAMEMQAIARSHRIGQTRKVKVRKVVINDTIDMKIILTQKKKMKVINEVLTNPNKLSISTIRSLID